MTDLWDPENYLKFEKERTRPALDLIQNISDINPKTIVDLGCGTGNITTLLKEQWPKAKVSGVDNSKKMLEKARNVSIQIEWMEDNLETWQPEEKFDLIFSNAAFQWVDHHDQLFPQLTTFLNPKGVLAIQMPRNFSAPSHRCVFEVVMNGPWRDRLSPLLRYDEKGETSCVQSPTTYYALLAPLFSEIQIWETEYLHDLPGENGVMQWMLGTGLRPFVTALEDEEEKQEFLSAYQAAVKPYYHFSYGKILFPFKRLFLVGKKN